MSDALVYAGLLLALGVVFWLVVDSARQERARRREMRSLVRKLREK